MEVGETEVGEAPLHHDEIEKKPHGKSYGRKHGQKFRHKKTTTAMGPVTRTATRTSASTSAVSALTCFYLPIMNSIRSRNRDDEETKAHHHRGHEKWTEQTADDRTWTLYFFRFGGEEEVTITLYPCV